MKTNRRLKMTRAEWHKINDLVIEVLNQEEVSESWDEIEDRWYSEALADEFNEEIVY
jgi:hypothetical protein